MDLTRAVQKLKDKYNKNEISSQEYGKALLGHCQHAQEQYNIFISISSEDALLHFLEKFQKEKLSGKRSPMMGVPLVLGDNICTRNFKTTCASRMLSSYQPPFDATAFERLQNKGAALVLGKTNMEEFNLGSTGGSSFFKTVKNPLNKSRLAGSGAAAAVCVGVARLALASDARGELRQAASFCGVLALKPTAGRIPRSGLIDYASSLEQLGIMANKTRDLALALEATAGADPGDPTALKTKVPPYASLLNEDKGVLTLAVPKCWLEAPFLEDEVRDGFQSQLEKLAEAGLKIVPVDLPHFKYASAVAEIISSVEAFSNLANLDGIRFGYRGEATQLQEMYLKTRSEGFGSKLKKFLTFGALNSGNKDGSPSFQKAQKMRSVISRELGESLSKHGLLLTPTTPFAAPGFNAVTNEWQMPEPACWYTAAANLSGFPACTYPLATASGLPLGLQLIGKTGDEASLLKAVLLLEKIGIRP